MTDTLTKPPHWDMTPYFPGLDSAEFADAFDGAVSAIRALRETFDEVGVRRAEAIGPDVAAFDRVLRDLNDVYERVNLLRSYIYAFVTTDSRDELAQSKQSELERETVELSRLQTRFEAWVGSLDVEALVESSDVARAHAFALRRAHELARHQMSEAEEDLAASLAPSGRSAWSRLHGSVGSRLMVDLERPDGTVERLPLTVVRGLASDPDPALREAAFRGICAAWQTVEVPLAGALNSVKGWQHTLNERRGWSDDLEPALVSNNIDRPTLEAMQEACVESFPDFHRYLRAKARLLGDEALKSWDMAAPVGEAARKWTFEEASGFIVDRFGTFSDRLASLADRAFRERWIDAEPREGKRGGGYCMDVRNDESRIFVNFNGTQSDVSTVAHELGHAYHNLNLAPLTQIQQWTPMTLAETASTFCETIVTNAMLADATPAQRLSILDDGLQTSTLVVVGIHSRFLFEKRVFETRAERELGVSELKATMLRGEREVYGDAVREDTLHPYLWAATPHYYGSNFYNFPYTFGLLFGLGLWARFVDDPDGFRAGYDDLLASTGLDDAAGCAARFGIDVRSADFWRSSLDVVRAQIDEYEQLAAG